MTWWIVTLASAALLMAGGWMFERPGDVRARRAWIVLMTVGAVGVVYGSTVLWLRTGVFG